MKEKIAKIIQKINVILEALLLVNNYNTVDHLGGDEIIFYIKF